MNRGDLVRITRYYGTGYGIPNAPFQGILLEHHPITIQGHENPLRKTAKIKLLLSSGQLYDLTLFIRDRMEVISEINSPS